MAQYSKLQTLSAIKETGMVPVFYNADLEISKNVIKACFEGGVKAFEFTNRGDFAQETFGALVKWVSKECPGMILGAGTIVDAPTAAMYIQLGANFIVGPLLNPEVAKLCNRRGVPYSPGCGTVTEIGFAQEMGCDLIKVFPASCVGGPAFVKDIHGPLPWAMIMVTGGVDPSEDNLVAWAKSGVAAVGMGSKLFPKEVIAAKEWNKISDLCRKALSYIQEGRK
jgi:2-dehydro-3-deoxyphosphogluconate aldolase/(4S)-4-hydroxy-2-oxoglutarate aldolase